MRIEFGVEPTGPSIDVLVDEHRVLFTFSVPVWVASVRVAKLDRGQPEQFVWELVEADSIVEAGAEESESPSTSRDASLEEIISAAREASTEGDGRDEEILSLRWLVYGYLFTTLDSGMAVMR